LLKLLHIADAAGPWCSRNAFREHGLPAAAGGKNRKAEKSR
jgi:hypothetical protein